MAVEKRKKTIMCTRQSTTGSQDLPQEKKNKRTSDGRRPQKSKGKQVIAEKKLYNKVM